MKRFFLAGGLLACSLCACANLSTQPTSPHEAISARFDASVDPWSRSAAVTSAPQEGAQTAERRRHEFVVHHSSLELDSGTTELIDDNGDELGEFDFFEVDQVTTQVRYRIGGPSGGFTIGFLGQEFADDTDLAGLILGGDGFARFGSSERFVPGLDYSVLLALMGGETEVLVDNGGSVTEEKADAFGAELTARLGFGFYFASGFHVSGGLAVQSFAMAAESPIDDSETVVIDASNAGPYARLWYRSNLFPLTGGVQAHFGDIEGIAIGVGVRF